jgi:hypothetical protein
MISHTFLNASVGDCNVEDEEKRVFWASNMRELAEVAALLLLPLHVSQLSFEAEIATNTIQS